MCSVNGIPADVPHPENVNQLINRLRTRFGVGDVT